MLSAENIVYHIILNLLSQQNRLCYYFLRSIIDRKYLQPDNTAYPEKL